MSADDDDAVITDASDVQRDFLGPGPSDDRNLQQNIRPHCRSVDQIGIKRSSDGVDRVGMNYRAAWAAGRRRWTRYRLMPSGAPPSGTKTGASRTSR